MHSLRRHNAIGRHVDPAGDVLFREQLRPKNAFQRDRHRAGRLARADDRDSFDRTQIDRVVADDEPIAVDVNVLGNEPLRQHGRDAGPPDSFDIGTKFFRGGRHGKRDGMNRSRQGAAIATAVIIAFSARST